MDELFDIENQQQFHHADQAWIYGIDSAAVQKSIPITAEEIFKHDRIACSISGGSDSDDMLDIVHKLDVEHKVRYVFFDTGIEMQATKKHLEYLEQKYGIKIERLKPKLSVGAAVRKYGYPFQTKLISEYISRLQRHDFKWEDRPFEKLYKEYPKCKVALSWWCNKNDPKGPFNILKAPYLKEFMVQNPPTFKISNKCCDNSKKNIYDKFSKENNMEICFIGIRKYEGGARQEAYKRCLVDGPHGLQHFPLFWFRDEDKEKYEKACRVVHSDAYTVYGCKRTGCAGCPFGSKFEDELEMLEKHEPQLAKAVKNIFEPSYEYTRAYRKFKDEKQKEEKEAKVGHQLSFEEV